VIRTVSDLKTELDVLNPAYANQLIFVTVYLWDGTVLQCPIDRLQLSVHHDYGDEVEIVVVELPSFHENAS